MCTSQKNQHKKISRLKSLQTVVVVYAFIATLAVIVLVAQPGILESVRFAVTHDIRVFAGYNGEMQAHKSQRSRADTLVILGDSIARGLDGRQIYDGPSVNFGIGGDTTPGVAMRVATYDIEQTETMIMLVGVNDLARFSDQQILANYRLLLEYLKAKKLLVCAVLPLNETRFRPARITMVNGKRVNNVRIAEVNQQIDKLCQGYPNVRFCDPSRLMVNDTANLRAEFTTDGVHPNQKGNAILQQYLKDELNKLMLVSSGLQRKIL